MENLTNDKWLHMEQAAEYLGYTKWSLYQLTGKRKIKFYKPGGRIFFLIKDLEDYIMSGVREIEK